MNFWVQIYSARKDTWVNVEGFYDEEKAKWHCHLLRQRNPKSSYRVQPYKKT